MDKPQKGHDHQLAFVGRWTYRNGIGITEHAVGFQWAGGSGKQTLTQYPLVRGV